MINSAGITLYDFHIRENDGAYRCACCHKFQAINSGAIAISYGASFHIDYEDAQSLLNGHLYDSMKTMWCVPCVRKIVERK